MLIRVAVDEDLPAICEIVEASIIQEDNGEDTGFFRLPIEDPEYYLKRITLDLSISKNTCWDEFLQKNYHQAKKDEHKKVNPNFYVAIEEESVVGFLMSCPFFLYPTYFSTDLTALSDHLPVDCRKFLFTEQMAVAKDFRRSGIGFTLYQRLFDDVQSTEFSRVFTTISHKPFLNTGSVKLHESVGFNCIDEMQTVNEVTLGIYRKDLNGATE